MYDMMKSGQKSTEGSREMPGAAIDEENTKACLKCHNKTYYFYANLKISYQYCNSWYGLQFLLIFLVI